MDNILFITTRTIFPTVNGRKVVLYNYCKGLRQYLNSKVYLFSFLDKDDEENLEIPEFIEKAYYAEKINFFDKIKNLIINTLIKGKWPIQVSLYYSNKNKKKLENIIKEIEPNIIICDMSRTAQYLRELNFNGIKVLDMDDLLSKRYLRQYNYLIQNKDIDILGQYKNNMLALVSKLIKFKSLKKFVLKFEAEKMLKYEKDVANDFDHVIFVSRIEAEEYNKIIKGDKAFDVTIGVDYNYYNKNVSEIRKELYIGFLGNINYGPNKISVEYFIEKIFPIIKKTYPNLIFKIIGKCSDEFKENYRDCKDIIVTGFVDDIRKEVQGCKVMVAPIVVGTGIKTKVLECMAMGVPVITNDIGAEGIDVTKNIDIIIENDEAMFAEKTIELLKNNKFRADIVNNANKTIYNKYTWESILPRLKRILKKDKE